VSLPLTLSIPDSAKQGDVVAFPTVQTYSDGTTVRWIGPDGDAHPAPTVDITAPGTAVLDVTGGDAGPPAKLPAGLAGPAGGASSPAAARPATQTIVKKESTGKTLSIVALALAAAALGLALQSRLRRA
jgi:hypothetical protein